MPHLPTIDESGVPGYVKTSWFALFAPAAVPQPIIERVYQASIKALKDPEISRRLANQGANTVGNSSEEFSRFVRDEIAAWAKLIREMKL